MTVEEFIDDFVLGGGDTKGYLAQHNLLDQVIFMFENGILDFTGKRAL